MKNIMMDPLNIQDGNLARDGSFLIAYIPPSHKREVKVDLSVLSKRGFDYWFDPTDGRYITMEASPVTNIGGRKFMPPLKNHAGESNWGWW